MNNREWTEAELTRLSSMRISEGKSWDDIGKQLHRSGDACRLKFGEIKNSHIQESSLPIFNQPLVLEGDALVLPDVEFPFHHAEFINKCIDLAAQWGIKNCILAGDVIHFNSLSSFTPNFASPEPVLPTEDFRLLNSLLEKTTVPEERKQIEEMIRRMDGQAKTIDLETELMQASREMRRIGEVFTTIDWVLGNHELRLLRQLEHSLGANRLIQLFGLQGNWRIANYYFSILVSGGEEYQIEHSYDSSKFLSASKLASKFLRNILQAHTHHLSLTYDKSGRYICAQIGTCSDERRMPYATARHNGTDSHKLGAAIVRNGYLWLLHEGVDWNSLHKLP